MLLYLLLLLVALAVAVWVFGSGLMAAIRRSDPKAWILAGLLLLASLAVPTSLTVEMIQLPWTPSLRSSVSILLTMIPLLSIAIAAVLLFTGLNEISLDKPAGEPTGRPRAWTTHRKIAAASILLSVLLLGKTLYNLYWLIVWDNTYDPLDFLLLILPIPAAIYAGVLLITGLKRRAKLAGIGYLILTPILIGLIFLQAERVDTQQLTAQRAGQVSQALEMYHTRLGQYPQHLLQLSPAYLLSIPKPVAINDQDWCYKGGKDYYQLGYVNRAHWSSPDYFVQFMEAKGNPPDRSSLCSREIAEIEHIVWRK
jgi:hypothetical protein